MAEQRKTQGSISVETVKKTNSSQRIRHVIAIVIVLIWGFFTFAPIRWGSVAILFDLWLFFGCLGPSIAAGTSLWTWTFKDPNPDGTQVPGLLRFLRVIFFLTVTLSLPFLILMVRIMTTFR